MGTGLPAGRQPQAHCFHPAPEAALSCYAHVSMHQRLSTCPADALTCVVMPAPPPAPPSHTQSDKDVQHAEGDNSQGAKRRWYEEQQGRKAEELKRLGLDKTQACR